MFLQGMTFLHDSTLHAHGNLTSSNCLVTSRWSLKVTDFGLAEARYHAHELEQEEHAKYRRTFERNASNLMALYARNPGIVFSGYLWRAPEVLKNPTQELKSQKADVFAFGVILYEMFGRRGPYGDIELTPKGE